MRFYAMLCCLLLSAAGCSKNAQSTTANQPSVAPAILEPPTPEAEAEAWVKSIGGSVDRGKTFTGEPITSVRFFGSWPLISDADLPKLLAFQGLVSLNLDGTKVTDAGLKQLEGKRFANLELPDQARTDLGLKHSLSATLPGRKELILDSWVRITDGGLAGVAGQTQLEILDLTYTQVFGSGLKHLAGMTRLRELRLTLTPVTDEGFRHMPQLPQIEFLDLSGTKIGDEACVTISGLSSLKELRLNGTQVTDIGLEKLHALKGLKELFLEGTKVSEEGRIKAEKAIPGCFVLLKLPK